MRPGHQGPGCQGLYICYKIEGAFAISHTYSLGTLAGIILYRWRRAGFEVEVVS